MQNDYTLSTDYQNLLSTITSNTATVYTVAQNSIIRHDDISVGGLDAEYIKIRGVDITDILVKLAKEAKENTELEEAYPELKELKLKYERMLSEIRLEQILKD